MSKCLRRLMDFSLSSTCTTTRVIHYGTYHTVSRPFVTVPDIASFLQVCVCVWCAAAAAAAAAAVAPLSLFFYYYYYYFFFSSLFSLCLSLSSCRSLALSSLSLALSLSRSLSLGVLLTAAMAGTDSHKMLPHHLGNVPEHRRRARLSSLFYGTDTRH